MILVDLSTRGECWRLLINDTGKTGIEVLLGSLNPYRAHDIIFNLLSLGFEFTVSQN